MSVFSGKLGKGAGRKHRTTLREQAYNRAVADWNDGTGRVAMPDGTWKTRVNPVLMLQKNDPRRTA